MAAIISSFKNIALPADLICFGEVGLAGEIRPVPNGQERLTEAEKHGMKTALVPKQNAPKKALGIQTKPLINVQELINFIRAEDFL